MQAAETIVVVNAGSSSIKFSLYGEREGELALLMKGKVEKLYTGDAYFVATGEDGVSVAEHRWQGVAISHETAMRFLFDFAHTHLDGRTVAAIGHRIVHGGTLFSAPVRLDADVLAQLEQLIPLAPLHQPHNLAPVRSVLEMAPEVLQIGCFDTAFHTVQPELAQAFALPPSITSLGIRRYGFHGLSYEYLASQLPELDHSLAGARVVAAHLGNGASMCAIHAGRSVASTMGFTAVDGLPMGTRCGSVDPGVVLFLQSELKMEQGEIERLLYQQSGLLGVSGISSDMRTLEASSDPRARLAIDLFVYRIGRELGSLAAALGGLDALVFTGGIGENSARVRAAVCRDAAWLGVRIDAAANEAGQACISAPDSAVPVWVLPANEELMIARHALEMQQKAQRKGGRV
ncbi:acetate/propionate family kinase [Massilia sp. MB5]|uniref:acetate/propionate family kinase n=1 Tax=unclassified Massilia TaxID=2609279 RepID=UPI00067BB5FB|nr:MULTISPECIES: acetate/propionate family kinase [unclassified Massilia]AKU22249.1 acetate kinase [Massilia sp. NR 4-1]UMR32983.1 acetate/propionate family kinase [Massilia sp. MB5]